MLPRFPAAFRPPASAFWHPVLPGDYPLSRSAYRATNGADPDRVSVFRTHETGWDGRPLYPGDGGVHATGPRSAVAACRFTAASPCHPGTATRPGELGLTGHHQGFTGIRPSSLPLACGPSAEPGPLGFPLKLRTPASRTRRRTPGRGLVSNTDQKSRPRHHRTSID
jgi:hypothetical protein